MQGAQAFQQLAAALTWPVTSMERIATWGASENNRRSRSYRLSPAGKRALARKQREWVSHAAAMFKALGIKYTVAFLALSFTGVALLIMNLLTARRENICPTHLEETFATYLDNKQYQEAFELAKKWWVLLVRGILLGEDPDTVAAAAPTVLAAARPFRTSAGGYRLVNAFRYAVARTLE